MSLQLPSDPDQYFIDHVLAPNWSPGEVYGYDLGVQPPSESFFEYGTPSAIDLENASYPNLTVQYSNETSGGESGYDFMTRRGPGQNRNGSLVATARVQDNEDGYTGDSNQFSPVDADTLASALIDHIEDICTENATAPGTEFQHVSAFPGADTPDDREERPYVRMASCTISYSWRREP